MESELFDVLKDSVVRVVFTKVNGDERTMVCTKDLTKVPVDQMPPQDALPRAVNESVCRVFDIEKNDWRSFRKDSVISWSITE